MIDNDQIGNIAGQTVYGSDGDKIGTAGQVYLDDTTGRAEWVTVQTGLFGTKESFVPVANADLSGDGIRVPFDKDRVKGAPSVDADGHISEEEEANLYEYYGLDYAKGDTGGYAQGDYRTTDRGDRSDRGTDDAMTRSEEQLKVGTQTREAGKARLRKYVVTENQTVTVPVTREEVRLEREPITDANRGDALEGPEISEAEHEVTLHEEQVVVEKEAVPVERVRLAKETVTEDRQVSEEVRKEQIEHVDETGRTTDEADRRL